MYSKTRDKNFTDRNNAMFTSTLSNDYWNCKQRNYPWLFTFFITTVIRIYAATWRLSMKATKDLRMNFHMNSDWLTWDSSSLRTVILLTGRNRGPTEPLIKSEQLIPMLKR